MREDLAQLKQTSHADVVRLERAAQESEQHAKQFEKELAEAKKAAIAKDETVSDPTCTYVMTRVIINIFNKCVVYMLIN